MIFEKRPEGTEDNCPRDNCEKSVMVEEIANAKALRSEILVMFKETGSPVWGQVGREKEIRGDQVEKDFSFFCE